MEACGWAVFPETSVEHLSIQCTTINQYFLRSEWSSASKYVEICIQIMIDISHLWYIYYVPCVLYLFFSFTGDTDITEKPVEPVRVHSEKELLREFEKIAATLVPEKDWSVRIAAMQRIEALVYGGLMLWIHPYATVLDYVLCKYARSWLLCAETS